MMDGVFVGTVAGLAGLIRSAHSGMESGQPRGVSYPGVPSLADVLAAIGLPADYDGEISEDQWMRACEFLGID